MSLFLKHVRTIFFNCNLTVTLKSSFKTNIFILVTLTMTNNQGVNKTLPFPFSVQLFTLSPVRVLQNSAHRFLNQHPLYLSGFELGMQLEPPMLTDSGFFCDFPIRQLLGPAWNEDHLYQGVPQTPRKKTQYSKKVKIHELLNKLIIILATEKNIKKRLAKGRSVPYICRKRLVADITDSFC